jgi:hypothetical protein
MDPTIEQIDAWLTYNDNDDYDRWILKHILGVLWVAR